MADEEDNAQFFKDRPLCLRFENANGSQAVRYVRRDLYDVVVRAMTTMLGEMQAMLPDGMMPPGTSDALREAERVMDQVNSQP